MVFYDKGRQFAWYSLPYPLNVRGFFFVYFTVAATLKRRDYLSLQH